MAKFFGTKNEFHEHLEVTLPAQQTIIVKSQGNSGDGALLGFCTRISMFADLLGQ